MWSWDHMIDIYNWVVFSNLVKDQIKFLMNIITHARHIKKRHVNEIKF
jgi:hypothetical protein